MKRLFLPLLSALICFSASSQTTTVYYLSGTDKDHTVPWDFYCTGGRNSGKWTKIPVPSCWELQGFGSYNYGHDKIKSDEQGLYKYKFKTQPDWRGKKVLLVFEGSMTDTRVSVNGKEAGAVHQGSFYRFKYDITALINANEKDTKDANGENLLEVTVSKMSANASVNNAERGNSDFWLFGGIYRPVYLEIVPETHIDRVAIDAKADGSFQMDAYAQNIRGDEMFVAQIKKINGENVGKPFNVKASGSSGASVTSEVAGASGEAAASGGKPATSSKWVLTTKVINPLLWSSEFPNLYEVELSVRNNKGIIHQIRQRFGFRTVELRKGDGFYVNGVKILFKGSDRHSFWPETGRTLSHGIHLMDVRLMKEMNMNAVRMSHYPPDRDFLDVCDSLGLYVLDELTGWQAAYDTVVGHKLVKEMVIRDVNHPAIVIWDNGNEGGWNRGLDNDYALYDPQRRIVIHPTDRLNGTNTKHYPNYQYVVHSVAEEKDVFFPTEFMHGLYDGGAGAGLDDYWNLMLRHPHGAGGFIWAFLDEAVIRTDKDGVYDSDGNHAPDGIVGPHREKEASFYTVKEIWSPVSVEPPILDKTFKGRLTIGNRYFFTNLKQCSFSWRLASFPSPTAKTTRPTITATGIPAPVDVLPGKTGILTLPLPANWKNSDALYLTAYGPDKKELFTWSWAIRDPAAIGRSAAETAEAMHTAGRSGSKESRSGPKESKGSGSKESASKGSGPNGSQIPKGDEQGGLLIVTCNGLKYCFDKTTGYLEKVIKPGSEVSLSGGPVLAGVVTSLTRFQFDSGDKTGNKTGDKNSYVVQADYQGAGTRDTAANGSTTIGAAIKAAATLHVQWTFTAGKPVKLEYRYTQTGAADFTGITFNYPEEKVTGMKWLGRGPYRVWKNRLKGQSFGVWYKDYNNAVTGEDWKYPEFKGYHAEVNWVVIDNKESPFTVYTETPNLYLQMFHPQRAKDSPANNHVDPAFPEGGIGFLHTIPPIGDKFMAADQLGPQSQKNQLTGEPVSGTLWFDFGR